MKPQEVELWAREIIAAVVSNQPIEDSRVELKATWIEPDKAAHRLAAQANAARGEEILWLVGVDERNHAITGADPRELESWYKSVERNFDGFAPRLIVDVNIRIDRNTMAALYFDTERESPYVVSNSKGGGGYPEYIVPWREGTRLRAARREELLRILVPIRRFSALLDELDFNATIARAANSPSDYHAWGCLFREEEFHRALRDGAINTLSADLKASIHQAYLAMGRANQRALGALSISTDTSAGMQQHNKARQAFIDSIPKIEATCSMLRAFLKQ